MVRMDEQRYRQRVQWLVFIGAGLLLLLLLGAWISEGMNREWRKVQKEYANLLKANEGSGNVLVERGIFQVNLPGFNRSDRCISCHLGIEDQEMQQAPQPHTSHPGQYLEVHPLQQYGCTICHGGQPGALTMEDAFGQLPETYWPYPLLEQPYLQSSCGKCHLAIFTNRPSNDPEDNRSGPLGGMDVFLTGKTIFSTEGCLGCHQARGVGGILGPDLTEQGEKTRHEYSFQNISGEQTISNWLKEHFRDPEMVSPGSQMLRINLEEEDLMALATFVMGLAKPDIPFEYFSMATLNEFKGNREPLEGGTGFSYFCSACHGKSGEGKNYNDFKTGVPAIENPDFLRVVSAEYIRFTIEKGRSQRQMGSWSTDISGLNTPELDAITNYLYQNKVTSDRTGLYRLKGTRSRGAELYNDFCKACHGSDGKGGVAVALNQDGFLQRADNQYIMATMLRGRRNAGMPGWFQLDDEKLVDIMTYIASWRTGFVFERTPELPEADLDQGALQYHFLCSRCHGEFGEGETGPAIINRDFLESADNRMLYETIALGRPHTAMFGWSTDLYNQEKLDLQDISNIIGYMRTSVRNQLTYIYQGRNPGQVDEGALLFEKYCSECHGKSGEGVKAPALNNQEFLSAASNGYLLATITVGRSGTDMPPWGYGDQEHPLLTGKQRQDLVAYIRSFQRIHIKF